MEGVKRASPEEAADHDLGHLGGALLEVMDKNGDTIHTRVPDVSLQDLARRASEFRLDTDPDE